MEAALNHIESWTPRYQEENNYKPTMSLDHSANTLHSDLNEGIQLIRKLIKKTKERKCTQIAK